VEMVKEFYASFVATLHNDLPLWAKALTQHPLFTTLVWSIPVYLSEAMIHHFLYDPSHAQPINTTEYDYQIGVVHDRASMCDTEQRETLLQRRARHIVDEGVNVEWVCDMTLPIKKATFNFAATF